MVAVVFGLRKSRMRIFLVLNPSGNLSVPGSLTWLYNLYEPLIDLGHDVFLLRIDEVEKKLRTKVGSKKFKEKFSEYLINKVIIENEKKHLDLFFSYFENDFVYGDVINLIKKLNVLTVNFSCNNTHQFYLTEEIAAYYDYNLHSEKDAGEKFRKIGAEAVWFQMGANPKYYYPQNCEIAYDVTFVGTNYAERAKKIGFLLENDVCVECFGANWLTNRPYPHFRKIFKEIKRLEKIFSSIFYLNSTKRFKTSTEINYYDFQCYLREKFSNRLHYPISDNDMVKLYSQSKINLGFLEVFANDNDASSFTRQHLHLREFEIPMSGGLYFTNYSEELAEHYIPDKEVVVFRDPYELLDKIRFYLANQREAEIIKNNGHKRAMLCHTYHKRFQDLFKLIL